MFSKLFPIESCEHNNCISFVSLLVFVFVFRLFVCLFRVRSRARMKHLQHFHGAFPLYIIIILRACLRHLEKTEPKYYNFIRREGEKRTGLFTLFVFIRFYWFFFSFVLCRYVASD